MYMYMHVKYMPVQCTVPAYKSIIVYCTMYIRYMYTRHLAIYSVYIVGVHVFVPTDTGPLVISENVTVAVWCAVMNSTQVVTVHLFTWIKNCLGREGEERGWKEEREGGRGRTQVLPYTHTRTSTHTHTHTVTSSSYSSYRQYRGS